MAGYKRLARCPGYDGLDQTGVVNMARMLISNGYVVTVDGARNVYPGGYRGDRRRDDLRGRPVRANAGGRKASTR